MARGETLQYHRLRAPQANGEKLIDPPEAEAGELIARNRTLAQASRVDLSGRSLTELAQAARGELLHHAWDYTRQYRDAREPDWSRVAGTNAAPIVLAGHQPQLFHPGVWFKNFVLSRLAKHHHGTAVNLVIDSDTIKSAAIRAPAGTARSPLLETIAFDQATSEIPYEERPIVCRNCFHDFGSRVQETIGSLIPDPFVCQFWPRVLARAAAGFNLGEAISQARHQQEASWGGDTLELPQSRIGDFASFHWFAAHLLGRAAELRDVYNAAVAEYRRINHVRSTAHPVPDLAQDGEWIETPFWIWTSADPRRRHVFVRPLANELQVSDRQGLEFSLPLGRDGSAQNAAEQIGALRARGVKLRTRALVTTMFARLVLGDLFLHGIGGAKYDQVTDLIIRRLFGLEPPGYMTVTATLRLPIMRPVVTPEQAREIDHALRELTYHPERWLNGSADDPQVQSLVGMKRRWIDTEPSIENARARCRAIREVNAALQPWVSDRREHLQREREIVAGALPGEALLSSREYAFCLYPEESLRRLLEG